MDGPSSSFRQRNLPDCRILLLVRRRTDVDFTASFHRSSRGFRKTAAIGRGGGDGDNGVDRCRLCRRRPYRRASTLFKMVLRWKEMKRRLRLSDSPRTTSQLGAKSNFRAWLRVSRWRGKM